MIQVILERSFAVPLSPEDFQHMTEVGARCMPLYRVNWHESLLAGRGDRLVCRFEAPDTEAVRQAFRESEARSRQAWAATVHDTGRGGKANVLVERRFAEAAVLDELQAREDAFAGCLELHRVTFLRTFFSLDRRRMLCLYRAPDAESVRITQDTAGMPVERAWSCHHFLQAELSQD